MSRARIAVLASGGGSNLQALIDHFGRLGRSRAGDIVVVASNRPDAGALVRAGDAGIAAATIHSRHAPSGRELASILDDHSVELIVLAGFLQLVPPEITRRFAGRTLNVHPAPLPAFGGEGMYGLRVHHAVLASAATMTGPTVHFVDEVYDHGATIAQWGVPVMFGDDADILAARVLRAEHLLYPRVVQAVAAGEVVLGEDGGVAPFFDFSRLVPFDPKLDDASQGAMLDHARC